MIAVKRRLPLLIGALLVAVSRLATMPRTIWELDEVLFAQSVVEFDPLHHHPHPPGYPLLVGLGKTIALFVSDPFASLVTLSVISCIVGFVALALAFERILGNELHGALASSLFYFSPAMLVHSTLALSDPPALMFLGLAILFGARVNDDPRLVDALLCGVFASAAIGCRPQYAIAVAPMLLVILLHTRGRRQRSAIVAAFILMSVAWLAPLVVEVGGVQEWFAYETRQARYVGVHDAELSRSGKRAIDIALRFIAHPWGAKWTSLPLLSLATVGMLVLIRQRRLAAVPVAIMALSHLGFCLWIMDPADGVRYVLPTLLVVALGVGMALTLIPRLAAPLTFLFIIGFAIYASPILIARRTTASPPVQAATFAHETISPQSIVLYETSMKPHAEYLLEKFSPRSIDDGLQEFLDRPDVPLYLYADGGSAARDARVFSWRESDAYGKLTRDHYRIVSLIPLEPQSRYLPVRGVHASERTPEGEAWRWLDPNAEIDLPRHGGDRVAFTFRLPPSAPIAASSVEVAAGNQRVTARVQRGRSTRIILSLDPGVTRVKFRSSVSFVPSERTASRDSRRLGVMLVGIERF